MKKSIEPITLLLIWFTLSFFSRLGSPLVIQIILCQMTSVQIARRAEKNLALTFGDDRDDGFRDFVLARWFDSTNGSAYTYFSFLGQRLGLVNNYKPDPIEDYSLIIEDIQRKITSDQFELSENTVHQLNSRQIELNEIIEAIANGQIIEDYPNDNDEPSYLICGLTSAGRTIHVQCSYPSSPLIKIMAVYEPDSQEWNSDFTIKRINDE
ncbi:DUF4258 domain-containing protein [Pseudanabaena sp. UWO311]|uniref:DUF4258 domain-containing protein n=1 Tax=Pseudanabaena sp. UWO311 TaxID=2487337 RepID=UPI001CC1CCA5|nr:DUF4258 domain-containing protein [Pseudanabaena sp. UWO311]